MEHLELVLTPAQQARWRGDGFEAPSAPSPLVARTSAEMTMMPPRRRTTGHTMMREGPRSPNAGGRGPITIRGASHAHGLATAMLQDFAKSGVDEDLESMLPARRRHTIRTRPWSPVRSLLPVHDSLRAR